MAEGVKLGKVEKLAISSHKGTPKIPCDRIILKEGFGVETDAHGGDWHRQVSLLDTKSIEKMRQKGLDVDFGSFAENIATSGICLYELPIGTLFLTSEGGILEVTQIGKECHSPCAVYYRAGDCVMPKEGIFARVLAGGKVNSGDFILALPNYNPVSPSIEDKDR
ncbi:MOSC domain-containing protein [bacterium]|nr:MOSC domain-containing protein [bacterium]